MLNVTEPAAVHLARLLDDADAPLGAAARFIAGPQGLALQLDNPRPDDETYEYDGRTILLLDEQVSELLTDKVLDVQETEQGLALTLQEEGEEI